MNTSPSFNDIKLFFDQCDWQKAKHLAQAEIALFCDNAALYLVLAQVCEKLNQLSDSLIFINRSLILTDEERSQRIFRAVVHARKYQFDRSIEDLESLRLRYPSDVEIMLHIASVRQQMGDPESAQAILDRLSLLQPENLSVIFNCAANLYRRGLLEQARVKFLRVTNIKPGHEKSQWHLSLIDLAKGEFQRGWIAHESRFKVEPEKYLFSGNDYRPGSHASVLVWGEQGVGDQIMFGSMLKEFSKTVKKLYVQLDARLIPLFRRSLPTGIEFQDSIESFSAEKYQSHLALGSLGQYVRPSYESFLGNNGPYLHVDPIRFKECAILLSRRSNERIIGISWRSSNSQTGRFRSLSLQSLTNVLASPGVRLVNLQYDCDSMEIDRTNATSGIPIWSHPYLDTTNDLDGLAALICNCDEIVSIGNTTAHLAAALGKKVTVLLTEVPNWRWMSFGTKTPWYESATVRRLKTLNRSQELFEIFKK